MRIIPEKSEKNSAYEHKFCYLFGPIHWNWSSIRKPKVTLVEMGVLCAQKELNLGVFINDVFRGGVGRGGVLSKSYESEPSNTSVKNKKNLKKNAQLLSEPKRLRTS